MSPEQIGQLITGLLVFLASVGLWFRARAKVLEEDALARKTKREAEESVRLALTNGTVTTPPETQKEPGNEQ